MIKIAIKIFIFILFLIYSQKIFSQERKWILFYENDTIRYFYDSATIHPHEEIIYVWEMSKKTNEGWRGYGIEVIYNVSRIELICNDKRYRIITSTDYHADGTTTNNNVRSKYYSTVPNSDSEKLMNIICRNN